MGKTDWDAEQARWAQQIESVVGGMRVWREAHPRATFREIADALDAELEPLRAHLLADAAAASPAARFTEQEAERPTCSACGGRVIGRGRRRRRLTTRGDATVELERAYGTCATCGRGVFPPGRRTGAGDGAV